MKKLTVLITLCCCHVAPAYAQSCADLGFTRLTYNEIVPALSGKRIEATTPVGVTPPEEWNEDHCDFNTSSALYKVGVSPNDPVDPRAYRGVWVRAGSPALGGFVQYNYRPSTTIYAWSLWGNAAGDLCWQDTVGSTTDAIAIDPAPIDDIPAGLPCDIP